jgi:hypothetical protein
MKRCDICGNPKRIKSPHAMCRRCKRLWNLGVGEIRLILALFGETAFHGERGKGLNELARTRKDR